MTDSRRVMPGYWSCTSSTSRFRSGTESPRRQAQQAGNKRQVDPQVYGQQVEVPLHVLSEFVGGVEVVRHPPDEQAGPAAAFRAQLAVESRHIQAHQVVERGGMAGRVNQLLPQPQHALDNRLVKLQPARGRVIGRQDRRRRLFGWAPEPPGAPPVRGRTHPDSPPDVRRLPLDATSSRSSLETSIPT